MTFFEAALHILEKEGKPLHFKYITERAVTDKLLSHVGKDPEVTMYYRLAAMAKRKGDRKVVATEPGTFGLLDWGVQEDPAALEVPVLPVHDETEPPLRPRERHPIPSKENVRLAGRGERRKHHEDREKKRRLQPLPELAFELLSQAAGAVPAVDLAAQLRDSEKVSEDLGAEALLAALRDDNRRRESQGRRPLFLIAESGDITLDRAGAPGEAVPVDLQAAFAQSLGISLEGGPARQGRAAPEKPGPGLQRLLQQVREHERNIGRVLRRRVGDLELGALELVGVALLEAHGFRDVRAAKRGKEGLVLTARRREGLLDVRYAARLLKGNREVSKTDVADLRKDLVNHTAHVGLVIGAGEVTRDARSEALSGGALMLLWCGEALAEKLVEKKVGATSMTVELPDLDESFFRRAREQGDLDDRRREERRQEREAREERERAERAAREAAQAPAGEAQRPAEEQARGANGEISTPPVAPPAVPESAQAQAEIPTAGSLDAALAAATESASAAPSGRVIEVRVDLSVPETVPAAAEKAAAHEASEHEPLDEEDEAAEAEDLQAEDLEGEDDEDEPGTTS